MAWQTTLLPANNGPGLADFMMNLREEQRRKDQLMAEIALRNRQAADNERQTALNERQLKIQENAAQQAQAVRQAEARKGVAEALDAGRPDLAHQIAASHGISLKDLVDQRPQGDRLMMPSTEIKNPPRQTDSADFTDQGAVDAQFFQPTGYVPPRQTKYEIAGLQYDPEETRNAEKAARTRKAGQAREAFGTMPEYADRASALSLAPDDIAKDMNQQMIADDRSQAASDRAQAAAERRAALDAMYRDTPEDRMARTRLSATMGLEGRGAIANAMGGGKADQNTLAAVKYIDDTIQKAARNSGYSKLRESDQMLGQAEAQINSNSGSGQFGALMLLGRAMRGGAATEFVSEEERKHLSGAVGRIEGYVQALQNGQYSDEQRNSVREEIRAGRALMSRLLDRSGQAMATTLREDPAIENLKGTANAKYRAYMQGIGRADAPSLFPDETNNVPALGSNIVKGGGSYMAPGPAPQQPTVKSVSGPLGYIDDVRNATKERDRKKADFATGSPEDVNSEAPLTEDPNADSIDQYQQPQKRQAAPRPPAPTARTNYGKVNEAQVRERARKAGIDPDEAVARARGLGILQ